MPGHIITYTLPFLVLFVSRMFNSSIENQFSLKPNEQGEYEVAKGLTAAIFRAVLASVDVRVGQLYYMLLRKFSYRIITEPA